MFDLNQFSLKNKVAIVTGGGRGIGQAIAFGLAKAGAKLVVTSRKMEDLEATAKEIKAAGGEAMPLQSHLGKYEEIQKMVDAVMEKYKRVDILVNNAGASPAIASVLDTDERLWDTIMNLNLKGVFFISQIVARIMKKQGGGKIINIASINGIKPEPGVSTYSISKAGVRMITKTFAMELVGDNIQVNTISPGPFSTKMMNSHWFHLSQDEAKKAKEKMENSLPIGRMGVPDEIVGAAVFLASDTSAYTTGAEIIIDGCTLLAHNVSY